MWFIEHIFRYRTDGHSERWDMVLSAGDVDEGRWRGRHNAEIYMAWLEKFWTSRDFRISKLPGPEMA